MATLSAPPYQRWHSAAEARRLHSFGSSSSRSVRSMEGDICAARSSLEEIEEESPPSTTCSVNILRDDGSDSHGKLYVAVGKEVRDGMSTLLWALKNVPGVRSVVLIHIHRPSPLIPMMGGWFRPSQLSKQQVNAHRQQERGKVCATMNQYLLICKSFKVQGEKLVLEMDDIAKGLLETINRNNITKFVMGATSDKHYSKRMEMPKSKTACAILKEAPSACKIWFVCRGNLVCTRPTYELLLQKEERCFSLLPEVEKCAPKSDRSINEFFNEPHTTYHSFDSVLSRHANSKEEENADETSAILQEAKYVKDQIPTSIVEVQMNGATELKYVEERELHKGIKETLSKEKLEVKQLRNLLDVILGRNRLAHEQQTAMQIQILEYQLIIKRLEENLLEAERAVSLLHGQVQELQQSRDKAIRKSQGLLRMRQESNLHTSASNLCMEFSYLELARATCEFEASKIIGEGGYGRVYKGVLRHTMVAVKILHPDSLQGISEFWQEVEILSRVRHPNLVTLIGTCPEKMALVYEFLPNGSLEDRLTCRGNTPALSWQDRIRISFEICSALIFLHLSGPHGIVHGDLKPANILLDANLVCKLSDFGISRLLHESNTTSTPYHHTNPKGTILYIDPEFLSTGELTPLSDVFSFGIILLRLLTGRPAVRILKAVQEAVANGRLQDMVDPTAGDWPFLHVQQLAQLGLWCCELERKKRPNLAKDVMRILGPLKDTSTSLPLSSQENHKVPLYFQCPILEDIMRDPQVAADGHTYEAEAIRGWIEKGHRASPVTKQPLTHNHLVPNHALRLAIQEWLQGWEQ